MISHDCNSINDPTSVASSFLELIEESLSLGFHEINWRLRHHL